MPFDVGPSFIRLDSVSEFGPHSNFIPTLLWSNDPSTNDHGVFQNWVSGSVDAVDMINALLDVLVPFFDPSTSFNNWTIFSKPDPDSPAVPVQSDALSSVIGTTSLTGWRKATQRTLSWRTEAFNLFKIVMLDTPNTNNFAKVTALPGSGIYFDLDAVVTDENNGFSGRDNSRPQGFVSSTMTLNEKLRRAYRLT
jgi:hypothetical protein